MSPNGDQMGTHVGAVNSSPCIIYRAFLNTGGSYCTKSTLCNALLLFSLAYLIPAVFVTAMPRPPSQIGLQLKSANIDFGLSSFVLLALFSALEFILHPIQRSSHASHSESHLYHHGAASAFDVFFWRRKLNDMGHAGSSTELAWRRPIQQVVISTTVWCS